MPPVLAGVPVMCPLVVLGRQQRDRPLAVREREHRYLRAIQEFLDHHGAAVPGVPGGLGPVAGDDHALARGQAVRLDDIGRSERVQGCVPLPPSCGMFGPRQSVRPPRSLPAWRMTSSPRYRRALVRAEAPVPPAARSASATPATSGASGPMTTRSGAVCLASATTCPGSAGADAGAGRPAGRCRGYPARHAAPVTAGSLDSARASACSRPPEPMTSTRTALSLPAELAAGPDAARPAQPAPGRARFQATGRSAWYGSMQHIWQLFLKMCTAGAPVSFGSETCRGPESFQRCLVVAASLPSDISNCLKSSSFHGSLEIALQLYLGLVVQQLARRVGVILHARTWMP